MTPTERAEKIHAEVTTEGFSVHSIGDKCVAYLAAQINEAEQEAYDEANRDFNWLQASVRKIYCSLTNNKLSKWNTDPDLLLAEVEDVQNEFWSKEIEEAEREAVDADRKERRDLRDSDYQTGFAAAQAKAVEIAKEWPGPGGIIQVNDVLSTNDCMNGLRQGIAARISEMKP